MGLTLIIAVMLGSSKVFFFFFCGQDFDFSQLFKKIIKKRL